MVASSLVPLGAGLAVFLLRASDAVVDPSFGGAVELIGEVRAGWRGIAALRGRMGAVDSFGERIASRLEGRVADARRRCEDRGVDAGLLRGAVTEVESLLEELAGDDAVVVAAVRDPDRFGDVIRGRVQRRRRKVEAAAEPFFDELVRAVIGEFVRLAPGSANFQIGALRQLLDGVDAIRVGIEMIRIRQAEQTAHFDGRFDRLEGALSRPVPRGPSRVRLGSRPMEVSGFVERREQEGLFGAVLSGASGRTVLTGMRGSGKSQLATAVAARCEAQDWELVAWVPAGSREAVLSGLVELGLELGVDVEDGPSREVIAQRCLTALASAQGSNRLIVFDDVENPDDLTGLVPRGEGVRVLVTTTRRADWEGAGWAHVPVGVFEREQSIGILLDRTDQTGRGAADAIAGVLGDLPVAVAQAAATAGRDRYTLVAYLDMLERTTLEEGVRRREGDEYPEAVGVALWLAFQSALERIEDQSPRRGAIARVQLGVLSVLAATGVPARWLEALDGGSADARGALSGLIDSSVCQLSKDRSKVMIHGLQGRAIREAWKDEPESWGRVEEEAAGLLGAVDVTAIPVSDSTKWRREALDLVEQLRAAAGQDHSKSLFSHSRTADALALAPWYAVELGDPQAAVSLSDAVDLLDEALGPDHPGILVSRVGLAFAYLSAGRIDEAIGLFERTLADCERVLGDDDHYTLFSRVGLAGAYQAAGRIDEAIGLFERTLADCERVLGDDDHYTLFSRVGLAGAYRDAGRIDEAIGLFERTLADCERVLGADHPGILVSRGGLAAAYRAAGRIDEAIDLHEQELADCERVLGADHPYILVSRGGLAAAYRAAGRIDEAIDLHEQELADCERVLGPDHPHTLSSRNNLANAYQAAGRPEQAIGLHKKNLADRLRVLGPDHPHTLSSRNNLANAYQAAGRPEQAIGLHKKNLADRLRVLGPDHPDTLTSRNNLAHAYWSADRVNEAVPLFERNLADRLRVLGPDHPHTLSSRNNLANAYQAAGRPEQAIGLHKKNLADRLRVLGPDHPHTLSSRNNLANAYQAAGRPEQAIGLHKKNLADRLRVLGPDHPDALTSRNNLAAAYRSTGRFDQAIPLFERTLADRERILGDDHPHTLTSRDNLAAAYRSTGRFDQAIPLFERTLADRERILGDDHPRTLTSRGNLAAAYWSADRLDQAVPLFEQNLAEALRILGLDHPNTLTSRDNLAHAYRSADRLDEAVPLFEQNLAEALRILGLDHPNTLTFRNNLAHAYRSADRLDEAIPLFEQNLAEALRILGPDHPHTKTFRKNLAATYRAVGRDEEAAALLDPPPDPDDTDTEAPV